MVEIRKVHFPNFMLVFSFVEHKRLTKRGIRGILNRYKKTRLVEDGR